LKSWKPLITRSSRSASFIIFEFNERESLQFNILKWSTNHKINPCDLSILNNVQKGGPKNPIRIASTINLLLNVTILYKKDSFIYCLLFMWFFSLRICLSIKMDEQFFMISQNSFIIYWGFRSAFAFIETSWERKIFPFPSLSINKFKDLYKFSNLDLKNKNSQ
jgi:hypothetical protein